MKSHQYSFARRNGLAIFSFGFFALFLMAQILTGWADYNNTLLEEGGHKLALAQYLTTGHFVETTFENWESEFLQMSLYVLATVWLRQMGSSESKKMEGAEDVDRMPVAHANAPWPVKRGGLILTVYKNSLSLAFLLLFLISFALHAWGSYDHYAADELLKGHAIQTFRQYFFGATLWFESFQNWQSEFLAIGSIVVLSVYLRQMGSPESKPVDMPNNETP